jgi:hypothetical protein
MGAHWAFVGGRCVGMKMAKPRAVVLLALWVLGSFAFATLPGFAYAQTAIVDGSSPPGDPGISGDPDMPGEKPPAQGGPLSWNTTDSGLYAGNMIGPRSRLEPASSALTYRRVWFESLIWAVRIRFGW